MALNITAALVCIIISGSIAVGKLLNDPYWPSMFAVSTTGIVSLFGVLQYEIHRSERHHLTSAMLRHCIAAGFTVAYIVMVGFTIFIDKRAFDPSALSSQTVGSFTAAVGSVIAFFFGGSVYLEARARSDRTEKSEDSRPQDVKTPDNG